MADNYLSGTTGFVQLGGLPYSFGKWKLSIKTKLPPITNFTTQAFQQLVAGITSGTISLEGPYNAGNMPITSGRFYLFTLGWAPGLSIVVGAFVESIDPDNDADGNPMIRVTAQSSGTFTAAIT